MVVAPAGTGKSVLLTQFAEVQSRQDAEVVWIDANPRLAHTDAVAARLAPLVDADDAGSRRTVLVIDNLQVIHGSDGETALFELIDRLPVATSVLIASRRMPAYDLSAWWVADDVVEVGFDDLRFPSREVDRLFGEVYGAPLAAEEVARVAECTDGWAAALRLLDVATNGRHPAERRRVLESPMVRWPSVRDYITRTVLAGVDVRTRLSFALAGALGSLTAERGDELLGRRGMRAMLADLHDRRLLTHDLASGSYRVPRWLADFLDDVRREELGPERDRAWLERSGAILARDGEPAEAARCLARAGADDALEELLSGPDGEAVAARPARWLGLVPTHLAAHPRVMLATARHRVAAGDLPGALDAYRRAEAVAATEDEAEARRHDRLTLEAWLATDPPPEGTGVDGPSESLLELRQATHREPGAVAQRLLRRQHLGPVDRLTGAIAALLAGDVDEARRLLDDLTRAATAHPAVPVVARFSGALIEAFAFSSRGSAVAELESVAAEAERLDLPWLATIASSVVDLISASPATVSRLVADRDLSGDPWGALVVALLGGALAADHDPASTTAAQTVGDVSSRTVLDDAVGRARRLSAGVLEAWARSVLAVFEAGDGSPEAQLTADAAGAAARDVGLPGAQAVAHAALARLGGTDADAHRTLAESYAAATCASGPAIIARIMGSPLERPPGAPVVLGRDEEIAALAARYDLAAQGTPQLVRLVGEAGMGKTALLATLADHVRHRGGQIARVTIDPDAPRSTVWSDLIAEQTRGTGADVIRLVLGRDMGDLGPSEIERLDESEFRDLASRLLDWAARRRPLAVLVDDTHHADTRSFGLLVDIVSVLRDLPLLVAVAYREAELTPAAVDRLDAAAAPGLTVRLDGLQGDDLGALVALEIGRQPSPGLVAAVTRLTGGAPGFVRESVARLGQAPAEREIEGLSVPGGLRDLLDRRLARLPAPDAQLLRVAAVLGEPVDEMVLAAATGTARADVGAALGAAARLRLMVRESDRRWSFTSSIFAKVLIAEIPDRDRIRLHRRAADHLESLAGSLERPPADELAEHLLAAQEPSATRVVRWVTQAAADAERIGDVERAVDLCQRALNHVGADPAARGRLLLRVASARRISGGDRQAVGPFLAAVNAARAAGDADLFARAVNGYARTLREFWRSDERLPTLLREALDRLPAHDTPLAAQIEARLAELLTLRLPTAEAGARLSTQACDRAYRVDDPAAVAAALSGWYLTLAGLEDTSARLDVGAELARYAGDAGDGELLLDARRFRHHDLLTMGDVAAADIELAAFRRVTGERLAAGSGWRLELARAGRALLDGRFDDAETLAESALQAARPLTTSRFPSEVRLAQRVVWARETGELALVESSVREMVETLPERPFWRAAQAWVLAETGRLAGARSELSRMLADDLGTVEIGPFWLPTAWLLGETAVRVGRREEAERLYRALLPWADTIAVVPISVAVLGSVAKVLGKLAAALGELDDAVAHFESALDREVRLGSGPLLAWTKLAYAATLLGSGGRDHPAQGQALLSDAVETARGYGMNGVLITARQLASHLEAPAGRGAAGREPAAAPASRPTIVGRGPARPTSHLRCLGGFELELRGRPIDGRALKPRVRAVLWVLAANAGRPVHAEELIDALWPGVPADAGRRNLQVAISSLRQALEPGVKRGPWQTVAREGDTYRLVLGDDVESDIRTFELAVAAARHLRSEGRTAEAADRFEQAVRVYGGELIPEAGPADWIIARRDGLRLGAAEAAQAAAELRLDAGAVAAALASCERGLQIDRYRDGLWRLLIRCCETDGNPAAAARARREYETVLAELGLSP